MKNKGLLVVISGPAGTGKGTVVTELQKSGNVCVSVSATTRSPRAGEVDGRQYHFLTREAFLQMIEENGFLEGTGTASAWQRYRNRRGYPEAVSQSQRGNAAFKGI